MSSVPTQRPAVTVALPVYNGARFVHRAISSVVAQQGWDVNIVAVDDGSTDDSADVLAALAAHDARIEVITFDRNRGVAAARNAAMAHRDDPLVAMIDQDDTWLPGRLDAGWDALVTDPHFAFTLGHQRFNPPEGSWPSWLRAEWLERPQPGNVFGTMLAWRDRAWKVVGELDETLRFGTDDVDWFMRARDLGVPHRMLDEVLLERGVHSANASQRTAQSVPELFEVLRRRQR